MQITKKAVIATSVALGGVMGLNGPVSADDVASFYKGKTVTITTAAAGATYDIYSRVLAVNSLPIVTPFSRPILTPLGVQEGAYPRSA
jgi:hypothetical protein